MVRVLNQLASLLPGVVALIVAVLFASLVAGILYFVLRRTLIGCNSMSVCRAGDWARWPIGRHRKARRYWWRAWWPGP